MTRTAAALAVLAAAVSAAPLAARPTPHAAALARGRADSLEVCAVCHVVAPDQASQPVLTHPAPSFESIANDPKTTAASLRKFLAISHWDRRTRPMKMDRYVLPDHEMDDVISYILSLRHGPR